MNASHKIAECIMDACHGFTFDELGVEGIATWPVTTQNGETWFELEVPPIGLFKVIIESSTE